MSCTYADKVSLLIDGELMGAEVREVERHLLQCHECQAVQHDFLSLRQQLSTYEVSVSPLAQQQALAAIIGKQAAQSDAGSNNVGWFAALWSPGRAALAFASLLLIAALVGLVVYRMQQQPHGLISTGTEKPSNEVASNDAGNKHSRPGPTQTPTTGPTGGQQTKKPAQRNVQPRATDKQRKTPTVIVPSDPFVAQTTSPTTDSAAVRSADAQTLTAMHFEKSELLLRAFRNVRLEDPDMKAEVSYERQRAQQLVYQNMMLRREADASGDVQVATLLESLEPILIDIANLPAQPRNDDIRVIKDRVERKNIIPLLQVNSTALARALD